MMRELHWDRDRDRDESPGERLDRQFNELLQELRVTQTGIQLLGGFLLILPFQDRFTDLETGLRWLFLGSVVSTTLATFCVLAPVPLHRSLFRSHRKDLVVRVSDVLARVGLALLAVTTALVAALVFGLVLGGVAGIAAGLLAGAFCLALWWMLPRIVASRRPSDVPYRADPAQ